MLTAVVSQSGKRGGINTNLLLIRFNINMVAQKNKNNIQIKVA